MAPQRVGGLARLDPPRSKTRERPAQRAPEAVATADAMTRLTAAGNAARSLTPAPARPGGTFSASAEFAVHADAMPGAEHGLDAAALEHETAAPPAAMSLQDGEQAGAEAAEGRPVRAGEGPTGQADVRSATDAVVTEGDRQQVADDLTPVMGDLNGRPKRERFWSRSITQRHERYHANEAREKGEEGVLWASEWLEKQAAGDLKTLHDLLWPARSHVVSYVRANTEFPANEERAYGDGIDDYRAPAVAIRARGEAGGHTS